MTQHVDDDDAWPEPRVGEQPPDDVDRTGEMPEPPDDYVPRRPQGDTPSEDDDADALVPPHDLDAEAAVLSAVLLQPDNIGMVETILVPEQFYSESHRRIFEATLAIRREGIPVDIVNVGTRLKDTKRLPQVGGAPYLQRVLDAAPVVHNLRSYAITVRERWRQREVILAAQRIAAAGYGSVTDVQGYCDEAVKAMATLSRQSPNAPLERAGDILRRLIATMRDAANAKASDKTPGIPSGIRCLDAHTMGWEPGKKWSVVALSGHGKTTFAIQAAVHAGRRGVGVLIFSEMTREELLVIMLSHAARVDSRRIAMSKARATLTAEEWQRILDVLPWVEKLPVFVDDRGDLDGPGIIEAARHAAERSVAVDGVPIGLVIVDYIQRLKAPASLPRNHQEHQRIRENAKQLTIGTKQYGMWALLELAQQRPLSDDMKKSHRVPKPRQGQVQGCSGVEQEADGVIYLWRADPAMKKETSVVITKQRGSDDDVVVPLVFTPEYATFEDPDYVGFQSAFEGLVD